MLLLSIESSCDETAAAVVKDGRSIISSVVSSQISVHADYGGVVPEIASRMHLETVSVVIEEALQKAGISFADIEGIAVTQGPGLAGALLVGISTAKRRPIRPASTGERMPSTQSSSELNTQ